MSFIPHKFEWTVGNIGPQHYSNHGNNKSNNGGRVKGGRWGYEGSECEIEEGERVKNAPTSGVTDEEDGDGGGVVSQFTHWLHPLHRGILTLTLWSLQLLPNQTHCRQPLGDSRLQIPRTWPSHRRSSCHGD